MTASSPQNSIQEHSRPLQERIGWEVWCIKDGFIEGMVWATRGKALQVAKAHNEMFDPPHHANVERVIIKPVET